MVQMIFCTVMTTERFSIGTIIIGRLLLVKEGLFTLQDILTYDLIWPGILQSHHDRDVLSVARILLVLQNYSHWIIGLLVHSITARALNILFTRSCKYITISDDDSQDQVGKRRTHIPWLGLYAE